MLHRSRLPLFSLLALLGVSLFLLIGCSSSRPGQSTDDSPPSDRQGPALSLLYENNEQGLVLHDAQRDSSQTLVDEVEETESRAVSPSEEYLAIAYATADSSHLALLDLRSQTLLPVHAASGDWTYSLAWHPNEDRLAFGVYQSTSQKTRGRGSLHVATPDGATRSVGCRAASEVLHWLPNGSLAARDDENLYVVDANDCATIAARDARRMHHLTYAPDGKRLAFIHRELSYDREANEYVPDSSLVVSDALAETSNTLFGDERNVRHLRWSPDGSELAFDVSVEASEHRQIAIYNGDRTVYLTSPDQVTADQVQPRWSPSGDYLAFTLQGQGQRTAAVRVQGQTRRLGSVSGAVWGWLDERSIVVPGPDTLRIQTLNGQAKYKQPAPSTLLHIWPRAAT